MLGRLLIDVQAIKINSGREYVDSELLAHFDTDWDDGKLESSFQELDFEEKTKV